MTNRGRRYIHPSLQTRRGRCCAAAAAAADAAAVAAAAATAHRQGMAQVVRGSSQAARGRRSWSAAAAGLGLWAGGGGHAAPRHHPGLGGVLPTRRMGGGGEGGGGANRWVGGWGGVGWGGASMQAGRHVGTVWKMADGGWGLSGAPCGGGVEGRRRRGGGGEREGQGGMAKGWAHCGRGRGDVAGGGNGRGVSRQWRGGHPRLVDGCGIRSAAGGACGAPAVARALSSRPPNGRRLSYGLSHPPSWCIPLTMSPGRHGHGCADVMHG